MYLKLKPHLLAEVVNSVALGNVRAKMKARKSSPYGEAQSKPLALLIHGDAAFLGQGCSYENVSFKFPTPNCHLYNIIYLVISCQLDGLNFQNHFRLRCQSWQGLRLVALFT